MGGENKASGARVDADLAGVLASLESNRAPDPWLGQEIDGRYRIIAHLADGGMGAVYSAEHVRLGQRVAVKILRQDNLPEHYVRRFEREARAAARLRSPHIAPVFDYGPLKGGYHYLAMEQLVGEDLAQTLAREGTLTPGRALHVVRQTAYALDAAHAQGIVHRDLKPENIFLVADTVYEDFVKVLDFGVAKGIFHRTGSITEHGSALGTPGYMPPEQAMSGSGELVTPTADVYSLACVAMELLTGHLPIPLGSFTNMVRSVVNDEPRVPSFYGFEVPGMDEVFARAFAKDPNARYDCASAFVAELERVLKTAGIVNDAHKSRFGARVRSGSADGIPAPSALAHRNSHGRPESHASGGTPETDKLESGITRAQGVFPAPSADEDSRSRALTGDAPRRTTNSAAIGGRRMSHASQGGLAQGQRLSATRVAWLIIVASVLFAAGVIVGTL